MQHQELAVPVAHAQALDPVGVRAQPDAERAARGARREADEALELAEQTAIESSSGASAPNTYNPAIGAILTGRYADIGLLGIVNIGPEIAP